MSVAANFTAISVFGTTRTKNMPALAYCSIAMLALCTSTAHSRQPDNLPIEHETARNDQAAIWGAATTQDIEQGDQSAAFAAFMNSLNGTVDRFYPWYHANHYGTFEVTREYRDGPRTCRDFHGVSYRDGYRFEDNGTACKQENGNWQAQ
jgi:surface antigen